MERGWSFPPINFVKVNVHAHSRRHRLPNGNNSGIGVVIKDHRGTILKMYSGSIRNRTPRANELWSFVIGLRGAYFEDEHLVILETDNKEAVKEWEDWRWFLDPNHAGLIQQLEQRKKDPRLVLRINVVSESENRLTRWLAENEAQYRTRLVLVRRLFGRVKELWMLDMGLGPISGDFQAVSEDEYNDMMMDEDIEDVENHVVEISDGESDGEAGQGEANAADAADSMMVVFGLEAPGMGRSG